MDLTKRLLVTLGLLPSCDGSTKVSVCLTTTGPTSSPEDSAATGHTGTVGPCLAPPEGTWTLPTGDTGEEPLVTGDTGVDTADTADTGAPTAARVRQQVLGSDRLPADVIARLRGR